MQITMALCQCVGCFVRHLFYRTVLQDDAASACRLLGCCCCCCQCAFAPQVSLANTLVQWPYLADLGLISAIINVFYSDWGAAPKLPPAWLQLRRNPWLYFNLVITDSQVCSFSSPVCNRCVYACISGWPRAHQQYLGLMHTGGLGGSLQLLSFHVKFICCSILCVLLSLLLWCRSSCRC
jgi:hypothetical protein